MSEIKIKRVEIYGFGRWTDSTFDFTDQSFISLYGENEAGKSTLQQFIMYMLFGLPPGKLKLLKPKNSNKLGGKLTIIDKVIGEYTIERNESIVNCLLPNGKIEGTEWLTQQLKGLTRDVYESIYTFSALDLEDIQNMNETQLSDVLFSVGLTGATDIYKLEKQLDSKIGELFKPRGTIPQINQQLNVLEGVDKQVRNFKDNEATYRTMVHEKQLKESMITNYQKQITQLKQEKDKYEKIEYLLPTIRDFYVSEENLSKLPSEITFPEDGLNRFETNRNNLLPLIHKHETIKNELVRNEADFVKQTENLLNKDVREFAEGILAQRQSVNQRQLDLMHLTEKFRSLETEVNESLTDVELEESYVDSLSLPFHLEQTWHEISEVSRQLKLERKRLSEANYLQQQENIWLVGERREIKSKLQLPEEMEWMKTEVFNYENTKSDLNQNQIKHVAFSTWKKQRAKTAKYTLIGFSSIALILFLIGLFMKPSLFIPISILFVVIGIVQIYILNSSTESLAKLANTQPLSQSAITEQQYIKKMQTIKEQEELQSKLKIIENDLVRNNNEKTELAEKQRLFEQSELNYQLNLEEELNRYKFLKGLEPTHWVELLNIMRRTKRLITDKHVLASNIKEQQQLQSEFEERLEKLGEMLHLDSKIITFQYIENLLTDERSNQHLLKQLLVTKQRNATELRDVISELKLYEDERKALFDFAGVENEERYFKLAQQLTEQKALLANQKTVITQMKITFDTLTVKDILTKNLDLQSISFEITDINETLQSLEEKVLELNKKVTRLELEISQLESSDEYSKATYEFQIEKDKLAKGSETWAVLKVMQTVLIEAKKSYQEKHLTEVITYTTHFFTQMTNGLYIKVYAPTENKGFQVETENMDRFNAEELSQGTINQLYVSLRLAINKAMSNKYVVPLIIDDAFVHFDEARMIAIIKILEEISNEQQVLLFTCRKSLAKQTEALNMIDTLSV